jgi:hypothetical protein
METTKFVARGSVNGQLVKLFVNALRFMGAYEGVEEACYMDLG